MTTLVWAHLPGVRFCTGLQADSPEELQGVWLPLRLEEDVHRGLETLKKHELPAFPCGSQADTLNMTKRVSYHALLENAPERLERMRSKPCKCAPVHPMYGAHVLCPQGVPNL